MSRNKRSLWRVLAAFAIAAAILPLMGSSLLDEESMIQPEAAYTTAQVELGSFTKSATAGASIYWPVIVDVRNPVRSARLDDLAIVRITELQEGDYLGSIVSEGSRADLSAARLSLTRLQEGLAQGVADRETAIAEAEQTLATLEGSAREAARLRLEKQRLELERYRLEQEHAVSAQEKTVAEIEENLEGAEVFAPVTGAIDYYSYVSAGDSLGYRQLLISVRRKDTYLLRVEDGQDRFRYGMEVTITYGPRNARKTCRGTVVSSDNVRRYNDTTGFAWIRLEEPLSVDEVTQPSIQAETLRVDGVLLIPRKASRLTAGKQMVTLLEGASLANRYVNIAANNTDWNWVLQGLEEGQTLVLD